MSTAVTGVASINLAAALTVLLLLSIGCATVGERIDFAALDRLEPGVATIQDAVVVLGPFNSQSVGVNGVKVYGWSYGSVNGVTGKNESQAAFLAFGADGKLLQKSSSWQGGESKGGNEPKRSE